MRSVGLMALLVLPAVALAQGDDPTATTDKGVVVGVRDGAVESFLGIPYAAPPVGALRWRPPQPAEPWAEPRPATAFGNRCAAAESSNGPRSESEDCLFVNVQRPAGTGPDARLPVFVFIHGGGLLNGSSNQADMAAIVGATGIVGVSLNYRLGVFGFLVHPALDAESGESGNYGLMDQQAALAWVKANIVGFGGDPDRVTVGGESAGGWSVCTHLVAPGSAGLFAQAILQSASCLSQPAEDARVRGEEIAAALGCAGDGALECLRALPAARIVDLPYPGFPNPVHGTPFLPTPPAEAVAAGAFAKVPLMIGATRDEGRTFAQGNIGWSEDEYDGWIDDTFGEPAEAIRARYPWPAEADEFTGAYLSGAIITDSGLIAGIGGCTNLALTRAFAGHVPVYAFEFAHRTGPGLTPDLGAYQWGAGHAAELAYLFPSFDNGTPIAPTFDADEQALAAAMKAAWGEFVATGAPAGAGLPDWPPFEPTGAVMALGAASAVLTADDVAREHNCDLWDGR